MTAGLHIAAIPGQLSHQDPSKTNPQTTRKTSYKEGVRLELSIALNLAAYLSRKLSTF